MKTWKLDIDCCELLRYIINTFTFIKSLQTIKDTIHEKLFKFKSSCDICLSLLRIYDTFLNSFLKMGPKLLQESLMIEKGTQHGYFQTVKATMMMMFVISCVAFPWHRQLHHWIQPFISQSVNIMPVCIVDMMGMVVE